MKVLLTYILPLLVFLEQESQALMALILFARLVFLEKMKLRLEKMKNGEHMNILLMNRFQQLVLNVKKKQTIL
jgi:hypothetical protein